MKNYKPVKPIKAIYELEVEDPISYDIIMELVRRASLEMYRESDSLYELGLEKCMETVISLMDRGYLKIIFEEETDMIYLGAFNFTTGEYDVWKDEKE